MEGQTKPITRGSRCWDMESPAVAGPAGRCLTFARAPWARLGLTASGPNRWQLDWAEAALCWVLELSLQM